MRPSPLASALRALLVASRRAAHPAATPPATARAERPPRAVRLQPFPLRDVRLLDGPFLDAQRRGAASLLRLDPERLLHTFRLNAGLPSSAKPYGGWEAPGVELRGHSLGHYLSACALAVRGDRRRAAARSAPLGVVAELRRVQEALAARATTPRLPLGVPRGALRPRRGPQGRVGALLHAAQDPGRPARRAPRHRRRHGPGDREGHGGLGGLARRAARRRALAGAARDGVRRHGGRAHGALRGDRATPSTCASRACSTTGPSSTRWRAGRTRSTACTRTRRSRRRSAPRSTAS